MFPWKLTGTAAQQKIIQDALAKIYFPFERLTLPGTPELGWRDLNGSDDWWQSEGEIGQALARRHEGHHPATPKEDRPEPLAGRLEGRAYTLGVFFPVSARIYVDLALEQYPEIAWATVGAEIAHAVDEFLPLSEDQRARITALLHPDGADDHSWWEKQDYSAEYFTLIGEEFMRLFVEAYSDISFGDATSFAHGEVRVEPYRVREVVGVERTDSLPPASPDLGLVRYGRSKVYHRPDHYEKKIGQPVTQLAGLRPCKVCKPTI